MKEILLRPRVVIAFLALLSADTAGGADRPAQTVGPEVAIQRLKEGNRRFVSGSPTHEGQGTERRQQTAKGQHPFAVVLTCADSRLSPEIIFDQGIGDLFVVRNAGNLLGDHVVGSIEYAVEHLHSAVVVVLGHSRCGAVAAAVAGGEVPGRIKSIVASLAPAVGMARKKQGDPVAHAIRINAKLSAAELARMEPILGEWAKSGRVTIVAALYDIETGIVEWLP